ncbi:MAG: alpha/beta hydrolase [Bacteroidetes bacterium]|nr:alpha/beta hydrolase [Bacteroidota bacterium]
MTTKIYCISGLGADEKVFTNLSVNGCSLQYVPWLKPQKKETIVSYATRMAAQIPDPSPVILGVSFGGMMGIEIAKLIQVKQLYLISSIKSVAELPSWMRIVGKMKLNKLLPTRSYKYTEKVDNNRLGVSTQEERDMVRAYRRNADPQYLEWAINEVVNWKNNWQPDHIIHIHGDRDKIFPIKKLQNIHVIPEGTHMMIFNRAAEIGAHIEKTLGEKAK